jgi:hypothetical protein
LVQVQILRDDSNKQTNKKNYIHEYNNSWSLGSSCHHHVQNLWSSCLLSGNVKTEIWFYLLLVFRWKELSWRNFASRGRQYLDPRGGSNGGWGGGLDMRSSQVVHSTKYN